MQKTLESLESDQKSLSNVVSKLTAKAQDGGRSDSSSSQESDSDTESENEHESYVNPRNRKDFREEDIKRSNNALPKPKQNPIQTTTGASQRNTKGWSKTTTTCTNHHVPPSPQSRT